MNVSKQVVDVFMGAAGPGFQTDLNVTAGLEAAAPVIVKTVLEEIRKDIDEHCDAFGNDDFARGVRAGRKISKQIIDKKLKKL